MQKAHSNINWENLPSKNTPLGAYLLNKQDREIDVIDDRVLSLYGYQDRASASEKNAKASEVNAKTSETNAKQSELLAEQYKNDAFAGTPEGYANLVDTVYKMDIKETTETTLANSKAGGYKLVSMRGNSVQNGTPTPSTPYAIHNTGDCVELMQGYYSPSNNGAYASYPYAVCNKNKIPCNANDVIKLACEETHYRLMFLFYDENGTYLSNSSVNNVSELSATVPTSAKYVNFYDRKYESTEYPLDTVGKITLTINGQYVALVKMNRSVEMIQGFYNINTGVYGTHESRVCSANHIPCKSGEYLVVKTENAYNGHILFYKGDTLDLVVAESSAKELKATVPSGADNFTIRLDEPNSASLTPQMVGKITLTINGVGETTAYVRLNEPLREYDDLCKEDGLFKADRGTVETTIPTDARWYEETTLSNPNGKIFYTVNLNEYFFIANDVANPWMCDRLSFEDKAATQLSLYSAVGLPYGFYVCMDSTDTVETVAQKLNGATLSIKTQTHRIETLGTDSQIALNSLETFDGVTHINVDSRVQPSEIKGEYGTSKVGARTLKNELRNETLEIKYNELAVALVATESGVYYV